MHEGGATLCTWRGYTLRWLLTSLGELIKCCTAVTPSIFTSTTLVCVYIFAQDRALGVEARAKEHGKPFSSISAPVSALAIHAINVTEVWLLE